MTADICKVLTGLGSCLFYHLNAQILDVTDPGSHPQHGVRLAVRRSVTQMLPENTP